MKPHYIARKAAGRCVQCDSAELRLKRDGTKGITCARCYKNQRAWRTGGDRVA